MLVILPIALIFDPPKYVITPWKRADKRSRKIQPHNSSYFEIPPPPHFLILCSLLFLSQVNIICDIYNLSGIIRNSRDGFRKGEFRDMSGYPP
jgi:hypothetical protein